MGRMAIDVINIQVRVHRLSCMEGGGPQGAFRMQVLTSGSLVL